MSSKLNNSLYFGASFVFFLVIVFGAPCVSSGQTPTLQWELVNPFRFVHDEAAFDEIRQVYDGIENKSALALERQLQDIADEAVKLERAEKLSECLAVTNDDRAKCEFEARVPFAGWFARIAENNYRATCWDATARDFRSTGVCKDYISPRSHRVRIWITDSHKLGGAVPHWFFDGKPIVRPNNCHPRYQKGICIEIDVKFSQDEAPHSVEVRSADGQYVLSENDLAVKDKLIVGLGDSFASGEGNPDIPAQFKNGETDFDYFFNGKTRVAPMSDKNTHVAWLDRKCHRSMYSYQFKTALQLALANPKEAVTFVSFACAGATTSEIFNKKQKPNEGGGEVAIQLQALRKVLKTGRKEAREIDYLLISTGGNDLGFAKYVAYVVTTGWQRSIAAIGVDEKELQKVGRQIESTLIGKDTGYYWMFHSALFEDSCPTKEKPKRKCSEIGIKASMQEGSPDPFKIKNCDSSKPCNRIILTPYPDMLEKTPNVLCTATQGEFDVPFGRDANRYARIRLLNDNIVVPLRKTQTEKLKTTPLGWSVPEDQFQDFIGHGFCAQNINANPLSTGEIFSMPEFKSGRWEPFEPWEYRAYEKRERWFRLPVDAKLTTNQMRMIVKKYRLDWLMEDDRSNIMHPTAEAHAATAQANYNVIRRIEDVDSGNLEE